MGEVWGVGRSRTREGGLVWDLAWGFVGGLGGSVAGPLRDQCAERPSRLDARGLWMLVVAVCVVVISQQPEHLALRGRIAGARAAHVRLSILYRKLARFEEDFSHTLVPIGRYGSPPSDSARLNQARAMVQSPSTVRLETPRVSAASSTLIPPKNRSSTTFA